MDEAVGEGIGGKLAFLEYFSASPPSLNSLTRQRSRGQLSLLMRWDVRRKLPTRSSIRRPMADCVFGLKGNQGTLRDDVELLFTEQYTIACKDITFSRAPVPMPGTAVSKCTRSLPPTTSPGLRSATIGRVCDQLSWSFPPVRRPRGSQMTDVLHHFAARRSHKNRCCDP